MASHRQNNQSFDPKWFLERVVMSGAESFALPEGASERSAVLQELGPGYSEMGGTVRIGAQKRIELRNRLIEPQFKDTRG